MILLEKRKIVKKFLHFYLMVFIVKDKLQNFLLKGFE